MAMPEALKDSPLAEPESGAEHTDEGSAAAAPIHGLLAEYDSPAKLLAAAARVREAGFQHWDTFTPFPVHGIDGAMGIRATRLPTIVFGAGLTGFVVAVLLQWYTNAVDYPWIISGKPFFSIPANVPIMFELTVLFSAITTLVGMLMMNNLPHPSHPLDLVKRFARSTDDRFFLLVEARDPKFDDHETEALLEETHPTVVEAVPEDSTTPAALPKVLVYGGVVVAAAAIVPIALIANARATRSDLPRIHLIQDMDFQPKYKAQTANPFFADGRAMRPPVEGTIPVGDLRDDPHLYYGKTEFGDWATTFPKSIEITDSKVERGRERFNVYCAPCHGLGGKGDGMVAKRADELAQGTWVPPTNINQDYLRQQPVGQLFNSISNGVRNMPGYSSQITVEDRWAILLYVRALQRAHAAPATDLSPAERSNLK